MQGVGDEPAFQEVDPKDKVWAGCRHQWNAVKGTVEPAILHDMQKEAQQVFDGLSSTDMRLPDEPTFTYTDGQYLNKPQGTKQNSLFFLQRRTVPGQKQENTAPH